MSLNIGNLFSPQQALAWASASLEMCRFFLTLGLLDCLSGTCQCKAKHTWKCVLLTAPLSTHHCSLIHSMNIYLLPTGTGNWCAEYLEVTGLIFIRLSINIYIHSISATIYSWLILKLCVSLRFTRACEQIRASKISAQGLHIHLNAGYSLCGKVAFIFHGTPWASTNGLVTDAKAESFVLRSQHKEPPGPSWNIWCLCLACGGRAVVIRLNICITCSSGSSGKTLC